MKPSAVAIGPKIGRRVGGIGNCAVCTSESSDACLSYGSASETHHEHAEATHPVALLRPIVFTNINDPVGQGFVKSLAHPGGNITGFSSYDPPMIGKWLAMLTQIIPPVAHVAVLFNPATAPYAGLYVHAIDDAASSFAIAVRAAPCHDESEIEAMMVKLAREERGGFQAPAAGEMTAYTPFGRG